ncbi:TolC family protein [Tissierella praeacuta]|uniref:TolC family protein n=1 Tax=Tissierella praeacuta TaxID=43131 RepID=UPI0028AA0CA2|nr:TolC family protein [Tissierella praeacuta]
MKGIKKKIISAIICTMILGSTIETFAAEDKVLKLTMEEAVLMGIENSLALDQVEAEIKLADITKRSAHYSTRKLRRGDKNLRDAQKEINQAERLLNQGIVPGDISLGDGKTIKAGTKIDSLPAEVQNSIKSGIKKSIDDSRDRLSDGSLKIINALQEAGGTISTALDFASLDALNVDSTSDVLNTMADISFEVTQASFDIYKNSIALLIQKNYYDVLQAKQMVEAKKKAMERGKKQYEFATASYNEGLKPKDDMLVASTYYKSTKIQYEKAKGDLENALVELKKNLNVGFDKELVLTDVLVEKPEKFNLEDGLINGMKQRLEIKKTLGEVVVYNTNFDETKKKYPSNTFQYQEAEALKEKSLINFNQAKLEVESSIRQSYNSVNTVASMLESTKEMIKEAEGNLEIAILKYKEGFGVQTNLLKNLNLEDSAGTIIEVLAAEEKLAEIEENVVKITYAYNLARMQYLNNTGNFIY